jgi:hypothetical protein
MFSVPLRRSKDLVSMTLGLSLRRPQYLSLFYEDSGDERRLRTRHPDRFQWRSPYGTLSSLSGRFWSVLRPEAIRQAMLSSRPGCRRDSSVSLRTVS